ncbi:MAG: sulfotransferase [Oleiphilaceae bacterium]|nr:sulfotransferase [Oleiphilaceae bacterium]
MSTPVQPLPAQLNAIVHQGLQLMKSGQLQQAEACFKTVLTHDENHREALLRLSIVSFHMKKVSEAESALKRLLKLEPNHVVAQISLGNIYTQSQRLEEAIKCHEAFLERNGPHPAIYYYLAVNYVYVEQTHDAIAALRQAIALNPKEEAPHLLLGNQLFLAREYGEAQAVYETAHHLGFKSFELIENLAKTHTTLGDIEKAQAIYREGCELYPNQFVLPYQLSRMDDSILSDALEQRISAFLSANSSHDKNTMYAHYLRARRAKQQQRFEDEMSHLAAAHHIYREIGEFSNTRAFYLEELPQAYASRRTQALKPLDETSILGSMTPVFLVGLPRSGSTLAESMLCAGQQIVHKSEESGVMLHTVAPEQFEDTSAFWQSFASDIEQAYSGFDVLERDGYFTDKSLDNVFMLDVILKLLPKAKIIWCRRTPLASLISIWQNNLFATPWAHQLDEIIQYFETSTGLMEKVQAQHPDRIYSLHYEKLVKDSLTESKKLFEFCDLPWSPDCLDFYKKKGLVSRTASNIQVRQAVSQKPAEAYVRYIPFLQKYVDQYSWLLKA